MITQQYIYNFRSKIRKLYTEDIASLNGDINDMLYDSINETRQHFDFKLNTSEHSVNISLQETATSEDINNVKNIIKSTIQKFILQNIDKLNITNEEYNDFMDFVNDSSLICDIFIVGTTIQVSL